MKGTRIASSRLCFCTNQSSCYSHHVYICIQYKVLNEVLAVLKVVEKTILTEE